MNQADFRAWMANHHVKAAEAASKTAAALRRQGGYGAEAYDRAAMHHEAEALRYGAGLDIRSVPPPSDVGARAMDEALYEVPEVATIECVICGTKIKRAVRGDARGTTGLYCSACV
jgi:hypothetical protein